MCLLMRVLFVQLSGTFRKKIICEMRKKYPFVSVVMNCYNGEKFLREAIESVYRQTYKNWEIIFWDNCSTDQSSVIAKSFNKKLKYFKSNNTSILGEARVAAVNKAKGDFIAFLDSDDLWMQDKLKYQIEVFLSSKKPLGLVYGRSEVIFEGKKEKNFIQLENKILPDGDVLGELSRENFIVFSSAVVDREAFYKCGGFQKHLKNSMDYSIFLKLAKIYNFGVIQEVCCKNRIHKENLSNKQKVVGAIEAIEAVKSILPDKRVDSSMSNHYTSLAIMYLKETKLFSAFFLLIKKGVALHFIKRIVKKYFLI